MGTEIDTLVVGNCRMSKRDQPSDLIKQYHTSFALD
jgi:hypothetical protein